LWASEHTTSQPGGGGEEVPDVDDRVEGVDPLARLRRVDVRDLMYDPDDERARPSRRVFLSQSYALTAG
jgi:hypothetical protein